MEKLLTYIISEFFKELDKIDWDKEIQEAINSGEI
jgi:hypothetical protein